VSTLSALTTVQPGRVRWCSVNPKEDGFRPETN